jgi:citrate lyase subunit beta/citryl-CoA lyase
VPKVEDAATVRQVAAWVDQAEAAAGIAAGTVLINCSLESAAGVFRAFEIATAHPRVQLLGFGMGDFLIDLGAQPDATDLEMVTSYARSHIAVVSRVAGLRRPVDSVWPFVEDLENLEKIARQARALGYSGKAAIHPKQIETINRIFAPTSAEISYARRVIEAAAEAEKRGSGSVIMGKDEMIDLANVRRAHDMLALAERLGIR